MWSFLTTASQLDKVQRPALIEFESHKRAFLMNGYHGCYSGISQRHTSLDKGADDGQGREVFCIYASFLKVAI